jgi:hypothetical protein
MHRRAGFVSRDRDDISFRDRAEAPSNVSFESSAQSTGIPPRGWATQSNPLSRRNSHISQGISLIDRKITQKRLKTVLGGHFWLPLSTCSDFSVPTSGSFCKATRLANTPASRSEQAPQLSQRAAPPALCQGVENHLPDTHAHGDERDVRNGMKNRGPGNGPREINKMNQINQ